ncbi:MAG TPA: hypothetical protein VGP07_26815 [Polyangia bacterium]|jgi:hypothetical protein
MKKPRFWILAAATLSACWITFRVLDADASPRRAVMEEEVVEYQDIADPALAAMVHRLAEAAHTVGAPSR